MPHDVPLGVSLLLHDDDRLLGITLPRFDGLSAFKQRAVMLGREPA